MCRKLLSAALASLISFGVAAAGYDVDLATSYAKLFEPAVGAQTGKALHLMTPNQLVKELQAGKQIVALDVRTPNEFGVVGLTVPGSIEIPINQVFVPVSHYTLFEAYPDRIEMKAVAADGTVIDQAVIQVGG